MIRPCRPNGYLQALAFARNPVDKCLQAYREKRSTNIRRWFFANTFSATGRRVSVPVEK